MVLTTFSVPELLQSAFQTPLLPSQQPNALPSTGGMGRQSRGMGMLALFEQATISTHMATIMQPLMSSSPEFRGRMQQTSPAMSTGTATIGR